MAVQEQNVPDKELRALARRFKQGYRFKRSGGGHFRVHDRDDRLVELNGRPLSVSGNPGPQTIGIFMKQAEEARILKGTDARSPMPEALRARMEAFKQATQERARERQATATALRERYIRAFTPMGGIVPGLATDLGQVAALLLRQHPELNEGRGLKTPDLLIGNAHRMLQGTPIDSDYARIWELIATQLETAPDSIGEWYTLVRDAKGLPTDKVQVRLPKDAQDDWPFRVELLPLDSLLIDDAYQRPVSWAFVRREAARFDPTLVGTIDVAQRSPGTFAILDGQQRREIVRLVGKQTIFASVYIGLDRASEARHFLHKNRDRKTVHPFYTFRARVTSNDPDAIEIEKIVKRHGYELAIGAPSRDLEKGVNHIAAIAAVLKCFERKLPDGGDTLDPVLAILKRSTFGRPEGQSSMIMRGVSATLLEQPDLERDRLIDVLTELGPQLVLGRASDLKLRGRGLTGEQAVARVLLIEYGKRGTRRAA
jgi:hypothetical protein